MFQIHGPYTQFYVYVSSYCERVIPAFCTTYLTYLTYLTFQLGSYFWQINIYLFFCAQKTFRCNALG